MQNRGQIVYWLALAVYLLVACLVGPVYSWLASIGTYYQENVLFVILIAILSFVPYLLLGLLAAIAINIAGATKEQIALEHTPILRRRGILFLFAIVIVSVSVTALAFYAEPTGQEGSMGPARGLIQWGGLWLGGLSSGLTVSLSRFPRSFLFCLILFGILLVFVVAVFIVNSAGTRPVSNTVLPLLSSGTLSYATLSPGQVDDNATALSSELGTNTPHP
jgi:MFS family permease